MVKEVKVIGYWDNPIAQDIPWMPFITVLESDKKLILDGISDLIVDADFKRRVRQRKSLKCGPWKHNEKYGLFVAPFEIYPEYLPYTEIDKQLIEFVTQQRLIGEKLVKNNNNELALRYFDNARRVSNEVEDYVRVWALSRPPTKQIWADYLINRYAVGELHCQQLAEELVFKYKRS